MIELKVHDWLLHKLGGYSTRDIEQLEDHWRAACDKVREDSERRVKACDTLYEDAKRGALVPLLLSYEEPVRGVLSKDGVATEEVEARERAWVELSRQLRWHSIFTPVQAEAPDSDRMRDEIVILVRPSEVVR